VLRHMNGRHHSPDNTLIVRAFAGVQPDTAEMVDLDELAGFWRYTVDGKVQQLRIAWSAELTERPEIRREIVLLYDAACEKLGITPRSHE